MTNMAKIDTQLWSKRLKNHTLWGHTYLYDNPNKGVHLPGAGGGGERKKRVLGGQKLKAFFLPPAPQVPQLVFSKSQPQL